MANDNCDTGWCPQCHSCMVHCEDPSAHDVDWGLLPDEELKDEEQSKRARRGVHLERRFQQECAVRRWTAVRGNTLATYLLHPRWIGDKRERTKLRRIREAIPRARLRDLTVLFREDYSVNDYGLYAMVPGLPDFVVLRRGRSTVPFFIEVKYKETKPSKVQNGMFKRLEGLGFTVIVWRGGRLPEAR